MTPTRDVKKKPKSHIGTAFLLNAFFAVIELIGGLLTNSVFLMSDAIHDLGDALSLGSAWFFERLSKKRPDHRFTYGYGRFSVFGALLTGIVLVLGTVFILIEAGQRLLQPEEINAPVVLVFAGFGLLINGYAAYKTASSSSVNERMVSLHMLEDMIGWAVLGIASIVMMVIEIPILDPILSILFGLFILYHAFKHLRKAAVIFLEGATGDVTETMVKDQMMAMDGIIDVHHIHLWTVDGYHPLLTMHVRLGCALSKEDHDEMLKKAKDVLKSIGIHHSTIEIEYLSCTEPDCNDASLPTPDHHHHHHHH